MSNVPLPSPSSKDFDTHLSSLKSQWDTLFQQNASLARQLSDLQASHQSLLKESKLSIASLNTKIASLETRLESSESCKARLEMEKSVLASKYATLKKSAQHLEAFRRSIVNMVEYSPKEDVPEELVSVESWMESRVEEQPVVDAETSLAAKQTAKQTAGQTTSLENLVPQTLAEPDLDAPELYRQIRSLMSPSQFDAFADTVSAFNAGELSPMETVERIRGWIHNDILVSQFERLVMDALHA